MLKGYKESFDLVNVARYLHRPLLSVLSEIVRPGGVLLYHTFMRGSESIGPCRPKNEKYLLEEGELRKFFTGGAVKGEWKIVEDKVIHISDGRPCSFFVAQRIK